MKLIYLFVHNSKSISVKNSNFILNISHNIENTIINTCQKFNFRLRIKHLNIRNNLFLKVFI